MDVISSSALARFNTTLNSLFSGLPIEPEIRILSLDITHSGLGGFIGFHPDPQGEVFGRRIQASIEMRVVANNNNERTAVGQAIERLLLSPSNANSELLRVKQDNSLITGESAANERRTGFHVLYEFLQVPTEAGDIIEEIPVAVAQVTVTQQNVAEEFTVEDEP
jgi:hypothetical protein